MTPDVAQEIDVVELGEPVRVVGSCVPSPNWMKWEKALRMPALLASISATVMSLRLSSFPDGSPTIVVPPPISATGLPPIFCSQCSIMIWTSEPTCRDGAVQSKPM
jgi:hypothetical protein